MRMRKRAIYLPLTLYPRRLPLRLKLSIHDDTDTRQKCRHYWRLRPHCKHLSTVSDTGGARWPCGYCARRAIAEAKQCFQWPVIGWVTIMTIIYHLELLRTSEGTLSRWSRLHLQSLAPTPVSRRVDVRQAAGLKNNFRIFITIWWKSCCTDPT
jgi:hypothetical protein